MRMSIIISLYLFEHLSVCLPLARSIEKKGKQIGIKIDYLVKIYVIYHRFFYRSICQRGNAF